VDEQPTKRTEPTPGFQWKQKRWLVAGSGVVVAVVSAVCNGSTEAISIHGSVGGILALALGAAAVVVVIRRA